MIVVDDEPAICGLVSRVANSMGYESLSVDHSEQFADFYSDRVNVVVMDLCMPGVDGIELIRYLAQRKSKAAIVLMSGLDESILKSAHEVAVSRGLNVLGSRSKPFSTNDLRTLLSTVNTVATRPVLQNDEVSLTLGDLQQAIDKREIFPFYQPKLWMDSGKTIGVEALARWLHPAKGMISPGVFVPLFESHNLIKEMTMLMLEQVLKQSGDWLRLGIRLDIAVNMSPRVMNELTFPDRLMDQVKENSLSPAQIIIEVTESALFEELSMALDILTRLRLKGFRLSIDDFGTGYSSMQQLKKAPFTELKIDQLFVKHADTDKEARSICESTIELGHKLGMNVTAEGIESQAVWDLLRELGCDEGQGYFMGYPMPADEFRNWYVQSLQA